MNDTEAKTLSLFEIESVLLIDGDNDPHLPPDFPLTPRTLVRVFLRAGAEMPRGLARGLAGQEHCGGIVSPGGGANAADFVMSFHAGILHATLPLGIPFTMVTHDKSLAIIAQELLRVGRQAVVRTSHPERGARRKPAARANASSRRSPRNAGRRTAPAPAQSSIHPPIQPLARPPASRTAPQPAPRLQAAGRSLSEVASAYAARLRSLKDPPSKLKALLNDIRNRAGKSSFEPEAILAELKERHGLMVEPTGKVRRLEPRGR